MQFYFIRHGQSLNNLRWSQTQDDTTRQQDPELSEYGRLQAHLLAQFVGNHHSPTGHHDATGNTDRFEFTHLYSSLMLRAMATAATIAETTALTPVIWEDLHEAGGIWMYYGETGQPTGLAGHNRTFFETRYPNFILPDRLGDEGWWNRPFESQEARLRRAKRLLNTLQERHGGTDDRVAVVSHGAFYNYLLGAILNAPLTFPPRSLWFSLNNTGVTRIDFEDDQISIIYHNRLDFLPGELVT